MHTSRRPHLTQHALERAVERHGYASLGQAYRRLSELWATTVVIPPRYARQFSNARCWRSGKTIRRARYRVAGSVLMVSRGGRVVTTWRLTEEQVATVVWWVATNQWELA